MKQEIRRASRRGFVAAGVCGLIAAVVRPSLLLAADAPPSERGPVDTKSVGSENVNALLAKADANIRKGLLRLSDKFPQLKTTNFHTLAKDLERKADAGTVDVSVGHYSGGKGGQHAPVAKEDTYVVWVFLRRARPSDSDPHGPKPQMEAEPIYQHLGLVGRIHVSAGDEKLQTALKQVVDDALAPLAKLNEEAGGDAKR